MKRVFVFSKRTLFSQGIKNMLGVEQDLVIVGWESDLELALPRIKETIPDVVLHITQHSTNPPTMTCESLTKLGIKTTLVELSLKDDNVYVYQGEQRTVTEIGDLLRMI